ncbi:MAG: LysR family transcriptional regulator [Alphaproteobacteria bacterium]|nr:LysR family transcriptional regulator [Alphaproteobacteria bacterium]MBM3952455.1 LysR family transcriptional regulator [Rhodospirillales bacterium]
MEMHQVRYFLALAETLNFTRAADRCNVSQPSLTRAIKALEDELGGDLFRRERNNTHLTELGRTLRPYFEQMLEQSRAAKSRAQAYVKLREAPLAIGIMCTLGPVGLIDFMRDFRERHPGVDIHLRDAKAQALQDMLAGGELDVAIYALPGGIDERFHAMPLFSERFMVTCAKGHRFEALNAVRFGDLADESYLSRANCEYAEHLRALIDESGVKIRRPYRSERDDWILAMVKTGLGIGITPEFAVAGSGVIGRQLVEPEVVRVVNLVTVRGRPHAPAVGAFVREALAFTWPR